MKDRFEQVGLKRSGHAFSPAITGVLQRKGAYDRHAAAGSDLNSRRKENGSQIQSAPSSVTRTDIATAIVSKAMRSPGKPLDPDMRAFMEPRFGHDFSRVRVHTGGAAAESARAVNALAYTVGRDIAFAEGQYAANSTAGRRLIAHELAHVVQQSDGSRQAGSPGELAIGQPGDHIEREADSVAERIVGGGHSGTSLSASGPAIQRQTPGGDAEKKPPEKKDAGDVITEGLATVAEQAADNNPKVKKVIIDPIKDKLKLEWDRLGTGAKGAIIGGGAATVVGVGGAMLSDPGGRKKLEGLNLAMPLTLIPYMPLNSFKYTLPSGDTPDKRLFKFETGFNADDIINLRTQSRGLPKMTLGASLQWGYDPRSEHLTLMGGDATLGVVPGLSISAGAYKDILRPPQSVMGPDGQTTQIKKSIPEFDRPQPIPDVRIMINIDLMKFKPGDLKRQIGSLF